MAILSAAEKSLIKSTWAAYSADTTTNGNDVYISLFAANPSYLALFKTFSGELKGNQVVINQVTQVFQLIGKLVENVDDNQGVFDADLTNLASTHKPRGITSEHFENFRKVLFAELTAKLGAGVVTNEVVQAWTKFYAAIQAGVAPGL